MQINEIKKAVVLAAGLGTRLRPLTLATPKPLMPIWGVPMLERILCMLEGWGVEEIAINAHHLADQISRYAAHRKGRAKLIVSTETEILGTGGVLRPLEGFIAQDNFWLINGDIVIDSLKPQTIVDAFVKSGNFAGCWMSGTFGPRTIEADPEGNICNWHSDVAGDDGTYTYCGCALLSPDVIKYLPANGFATIVSAYEKAMMEAGRLVVGAEVEGAYWGDAGTFERYLEIHAALDPDRFEENPNVLMPGVKLLETADLAGCVITGGLIGGEFVRTALVALPQLQDERLNAVADKLGWPREDVACEFIGERGSNRSFWRFVYGDSRAIVTKYDDKARPENARYAGHTALLADAGVPVPQVKCDLPDLHVLTMEDVGRESLQDKMQGKSAKPLKLYPPVIAALKCMHEAGTEKVLAANAQLEPAFGPELYKWERELFAKYCADERFGFNELPADVVKDLEQVADVLTRERPVLVHRDFQSSNVLYRNDGSFAFIDYQGMRLGAAVYDLASLLYDPYVEIEEEERIALAKLYPLKNLAFGAVQRLVQALGAYGRLASVGQLGFQKYIARALQNLLAAADEANLDALGAFTEELIHRENIREGRMPHHHHHDDH